MLVAGLSCGTAFAAFTGTTGNAGNAFSAPDLTAPDVLRATVQRDVAGAPAGSTRRRANAYLYAQVDDRGQPPSGVQTVSGAGLALQAGSWTVGGQTYNRRSALVGTPATFTPGSDIPYEVVATDQLGHERRSNQSFHVDAYDEIVRDTGGLVDYWRLAETTGTVATDATGGNDGTYVGAPSGRGVTGALDGDPNTAATFDGTNDRVTATRSIGAGSFSVEAWFRSTTGRNNNNNWFNNGAIVDADAPNTANDFGVSLRADGRITAGTGNPNVTAITPTTPAYDDGQWHHLVFTRTVGASNATLRVYVDGAQRASTTSSNIGTLGASAILSIGANARNVNFLPGAIDEVAVYTGALSADTVADHYALGRGTG